MTKGRGTTNAKATSVDNIRLTFMRIHPKFIEGKKKP